MVRTKLKGRVMNWTCEECGRAKSLIVNAYSLKKVKFTCPICHTEGKSYDEMMQELAKEGKQ